MISSPSTAIAPYLDAICFIFGLAMIILGSIIYTFSDQRDKSGLGSALPLLALFGVLHGLHLWFDCLIEPTENHWMAQPGTVSVINIALLITSYFSLFEFGRRLGRIALKRSRKRDHYLLSVRVYLPLVAALLAATLNSPTKLESLTIWSAYLIGGSGAFLIAIAFLSYYREEKASLDAFKIRAYFMASAGAFTAFGLTEGLTTPSLRWLSLEQFFPYAIVIQGVCAIAAMLFVIQLMKLFGNMADHQIRAIQAQTQNYLDHSGTLLIALDRHGDVIWANSTCGDILGYSEKELLGKNWFESCIAPEHRQSLKQKFEAIMTGKITTLPTEFENSVMTRSGASRKISWCASLLSGPHGAIYGTLCSGQDTEEKKRADLQRHLAMKIFDNMPEGVVVTDTSATILSVNSAFEEATGYSQEETVNQHISMLKSGHHDQQFYVDMWEKLLSEGQWQGEIWNRHKDGEIYPEWLTIRALKNERGETTHYAGIFSDINTQHHVQQRLQRLAYYDTLTGLPNRAHFYDQVEQQLARAQTAGSLFGIMFLDFDRFKNINDTLGHSVGDEVLKTIGQRLKQSVRDSDIVARLGGDEFVVLLPELQEPRHAVMVAEKLMASFVDPVTVQGKDLFVTASVGISIYPFDGDDGETLLKNADTAMYHSKELGRNKYHFYTADMSARFRERLDLENGFRRALENNELYLVYQPQIDARNGRIIGIEALARWRHPDFGDVPPSRFISLAEESGMIGRMGEWVLRTACYQAKQWATLSSHPFRLAINLSAHQLLQHGLCETVEKLMEEHTLDPAYLELELTESVLMQNAEATMATLERLSAMGIELSIDDFGTGYSSLSYLKRFTIDKLKIDRSFVKDVPHDANDSAIAATVIAMARNLNLEVIAEGVETREQRDFLLQRGCHIMQGEFFSRPVKAIEITHMLLNSHPRQTAQKKETVPV